MSVTNQPPPGGGSEPGGPKQRSWAQFLGDSLSPGLEKNILEVVLDKDKRGAFIVSEQECVRVMGKIGIDLRPGAQVEGVQICPNGRGVIYITMRKNIDLHQFCRYDAFEVTSTGVRSTMVKPVGKKEVVVSLRGVHPNSRDTVVMNYLSRFGKMVTSKVVHEVFATGPLKGLKNGNRSYKMEIKPGENIGSYHVIDGQKVSLRYPGQQQTCGRCHQVARQCKGGGIARECEAKGGAKVAFADYIMELWKKINYTPDNAEYGSDIFEEGVDDEQVGGVFTPAKAPSRGEQKFTGVTITRFPKNTDPGKIMEFLCRSTLPEEKKEEVLIKENGVVAIKNLTSEECDLLIEAIHGKTHFDRKLYCNGIIPFTPEKVEEINPESEKSAPADHEGEDGHSEGVVHEPPTDEASPAMPAKKGDTGRSKRVVLASPTAKPDEEGAHDVEAKEEADSARNGGDIASLHAGAGDEVQGAGIAGQSRGSDSVNLGEWTTGHPDIFRRSTEDLVRRNSISLTNRTPPKNSLAADLLATLGSSSAGVKVATTEIRDWSERMSDFNSCISQSDSSSSEYADREEVSNLGWKTMNDKKREKRKKRKNSLTPNKDLFMKKQALNSAQ